MKNKKDQKENSTKKKNDAENKELIKSNEKEKKSNKFIEIIKKKWLIKGTTTFLLIAIILAIFITITTIMHSLELTPLDFTEEKLYTLTEESKQRVKDIQKDINIIFINYSEESTRVALAKQYEKANEKIKVEVIEDISTRPDLVEKYGFTEASTGIIVKCGEKEKVLTENDLTTYDMNTYETIDIAEEKLTSSIISISSDKIPKIYFLEGYSEYTLGNNLYLLEALLGNEINEIDTLNILTTGKVPDDCDALVITTPNKDFDDIATKAITDYIQKGKNILWLNGALATNKEMTNVNKILEMYAIKPFDVGIILETDTTKMANEYPNIIIPNMEYATITQKLYNTTGIIMKNATKINIDTDKLEEKNVVKTDLLTTSEGAFFRTNLRLQSLIPQEGEKTESFVIGAELEKTIKEENTETGESAIKSKLVIYGENEFISDYMLVQGSQYAGIQLGYNKEFILNSIAYVADREEDITARKDSGTVTYTPTEMQDIIIRIIIFAVPIIIVIVGIIVWQIRRRKK